MAVQILCEGVSELPLVLARFGQRSTHELAKRWNRQASYSLGCLWKLSGRRLERGQTCEIERALPLVKESRRKARGRVVEPHIVNRPTGSPGSETQCETPP